MYCFFSDLVFDILIYTKMNWYTVLDNDNREATWRSSGDDKNVFQTLNLGHVQLFDKNTYSFETNMINIEYTDVGIEEVLCVLQKGNAAY